MAETKIADPKRLHYYFRERLFAEELTAYDRILEAYMNMEKQVELLDLKIYYERIENIKEMVLRDHPEIFWTHGHITEWEIEESKIKNITFYYTMTREEREKCQREIDEKVPSFTKVLRGRMKDYDAALKLYERMIDVLDYDSIASDRQDKRRKRNSGALYKEPDHLRSIYGALVQEKVVCAGYAKGYQYLMNLLGLECLSVCGNIIGGGRHQWNIVRLNGQYYHVDVTWGDGSNTDRKKNREGISYSHFCLTDDEIRKSRSIETDLDYPVCTATKCNYFRNHDLYFVRYDRDFVKERILKHLKEKKGRRISLRFSSARLVEEAKKDLITNNIIFRIFEEAKLPSKTVWHNVDKRYHILTMWYDGWK